MEKLNNPQVQIQDYLARGGTLTVQQAFRMFHTTELRKIMTRLKRKGYIILDRWTDSEKDGRKSRYKVYYMISNSNT